MRTKFNKDVLWTKEIEKKLSKLVNNVTKSYEMDMSVAHIHQYPLPSKDITISILKDIFDILYPGYYTDKELNKSNINYYIGNKISNILEKLSEEIAKSFRHEHEIKGTSCELCDESMEKGIKTTLYLLEKIPEVRGKLCKDVAAAFDGDPAAKSFNEIIFSYPGLFAITVHRVAHVLYEQKIPLIPRIMSEHSHNLTGIDIHPGATIGNNFFIDHGTGVVIGETTKIGNNVKIYQGVTLGALSFPKDEKGRLLKGLQRHPVIEDNVTIYSGATILGGKTVIGKNSIVGGNVWVVSSVPPNSKVTLADADKKIIIDKKSKSD